MYKLFIPLHAVFATTLRYSPLILILSGLSVVATPPADPICGSPSSFERVLALRMQSEIQNRAGIGAFQQPAAPLLGIDRAGVEGALNLVLEGSPGQILHLEQTEDLAEPWAPWLTVTANGSPQEWTDSRDAGVRLFRLRSAAPSIDYASNFRLLDQDGVARDLFYHSHKKAMVVVSAGAELESIQAALPVLNELEALHGDAIQIWILLSDSEIERAEIATAANGLEIDFPVLADPHGIAAESAGLRRAGEVAVIQPPIFSVVYRGSIIGAGQETAEESFLNQALLEATEGTSAPFERTPAPGPQLGHARDVPDYTTVVAPAFHQYCAPCHREGGVAPFALTGYDVAKLWAPSIKHALLSNKMPPWHADREYGHWANDISIPAELKAALVRWIDAGAPRGVGIDPLAELPPPPGYDEWPDELGEPDALVYPPLQPIKATGSEPYRYIFVQAPNPEPVWLRAAIVRPSNYRSVHHYLVWLGQIGNQSPFPDLSTYESAIAGFVPGMKPFEFPPDSGVLLGTSNWLTFNLHYTPYGVATNDQPVMALWYHKQPPPKVWKAAGPAQLALSIPPRAPDHPVQVSWTAPSDITLYRLNPHMHVRGKRVKYEVIYPEGGRETLLSVPDYDFNWQVGYDFATPKAIPSGSRILISGAFDNSPQNLANPDPNVTVRWGDQSWMEMFVGFMDYTENN